MKQLVHTTLLLFLWVTHLQASERWNQISSFPADARHRSTAFTIGERGYVGLGHINSGTHVIYDDFWEYDPATNSWTQKANFGGGLRYQATAFVIDDIAYVGTGHNDLDEYTTDFWKYSALTNSWVSIADFPGVERRGAVGFEVNDKGYVGLGQTNSGYAKDFYEYNPDLNSWSPMTDFPGVERTSAVCFTHNGHAYVGTGHTFSAALNDFYEFTPSSNSWIQKANVGDTLRQDACGFEMNGKGYIATGNDANGNINYKDVWEYDFDTNEWIQMEDFRGAARRYMVAFVINNRAYCGGGTDGTNLNDFWVFDATLQTEMTDFNSIVAYPNPAKNKLNIQGLNDLTAQIEIYNLQGQLIFTNPISNEHIDISQWPAGNYMMVIKHQNKMIYHQKLIVLP